MARPCNSHGWPGRARRRIVGSRRRPKHFCNTMRQRLLSHQRDNPQQHRLATLRSGAEACRRLTQACPRVHQDDADSSGLQACELVTDTGSIKDWYRALHHPRSSPLAVRDDFTKPLMLGRLAVVLIRQRRVTASTLARLVGKAPSISQFFQSARLEAA
jgi:hypothetical protein